MASAVQDGTDSGLESYEFPERGVHLDLDSCSEQITSPAIPALHSQLPFQDHLTALQDLEATECTKAVYLLPSHPQPESFPSSTVEDLLEDGEISDNDIPSSIYSGPPTVTGDRDGPINTKRLHAESATGKCRKRKRKRKQCQTLPIIPPQSSLSKLPKPQFPANILSKPSSNSKSASQPSSLPDMALAPRHSLTGLVGDLYPSAVLGPPVSESPEVLVQKSTASPHLNPSESVLRSIFGEGSLQFLASIHSSVLPAQPDLLNQESTSNEITPLKSIAKCEKKKGYSVDKSKIPCSFWARNSCIQGNSCLFSHSGPGSDPRSRQVCRHFKTGSCFNGSLCPFSHNLKHAPCIFFHFKQRNGGCQLDDKCPYSHLPITEEQQAILDKEQTRWDLHVKK